MEHLSDKEILDLFRAGNRDKAFRALVDIHGKTVYNIALFTLNDESMADDVTQESYIKIYRNLEKFKGDSKLSTWMYRIVKNACYDAAKKRHFGPVDEMEELDLRDPDGFSPDEDALIHWRQEELRDAVEQLPVNQRLAITLYYFQDKSYEDVAAIMGLPLNTLKSHLHRAKTSLAHALIHLEGSPV
ncbi:RNA polymerase sigma factor [Candidatus Neomarinimicrobiota bacterium]